MKELLNNVAEFQKAYGAPCHPNREASIQSGDITPERIELRLALVFEEFTELAEAHGLDMGTMKAVYLDAVATTPPHLHDIKEIADALGDGPYVQVGMALEYGIPLDHVWDEIQRTNMAKFPGGVVIRREGDGKVMKPEGWTPPDIAAQLTKTTDAEWTMSLKFGGFELQSNVVFKDIWETKIDDKTYRVEPYGDKFAGNMRAKDTGSTFQTEKMDTPQAAADELFKILCCFVSDLSSKGFGSPT